MLNEAQKRSITSTLLRLETAIDETEQLINVSSDHGILKKYETLDARRASIVRQQLGVLKKEIEEAKELFGLEARFVKADRTINGKFAEAWTAVENTMPSRLRGYGILDEADALKVAEKFSHIAKLLLNLESFVVGGGHISEGEDEQKSVIG